MILLNGPPLCWRFPAFTAVPRFMRVLRTYVLRTCVLHAHVCCVQMRWLEVRRGCPTPLGRCFVLGVAMAVDLFLGRLKAAAAAIAECEGEAKAFIAETQTAALARMAEEALRACVGGTKLAQAKWSQRPKAALNPCAALLTFVRQSTSRMGQS